uniref:FAM171 C-terminal domain-containing protein n=1 Tax=Eptatretus burgeri TaxID=7764 RepID=A0A8C4QQD3_EPTBU
MTTHTMEGLTELHGVLLLAILVGTGLLLLIAACLLISLCRQWWLKRRKKRAKIVGSIALDSIMIDKATSISHINLLHIAATDRLLSRGTHPDCTAVRAGLSSARGSQDSLVKPERCSLPCASEKAPCCPPACGVLHNNATTLHRMPISHSQSSLSGPVPGMTSLSMDALSTPSDAQLPRYISAERIADTRSQQALFIPSQYMHLPGLLSLSGPNGIGEIGPGIVQQQHPGADGAGNHNLQGNSSDVSVPLILAQNVATGSEVSGLGEQPPQAWFISLAERNIVRHSCVDLQPDVEMRGMVDGAGSGGNVMWRGHSCPWGDRLGAPVEQEEEELEYEETKKNLEGGGVLYTQLVRESSGRISKSREGAASSTTSGGSPDDYDISMKKAQIEKGNEDEDEEDTENETSRSEPSSLSQASKSSSHHGNFEPHVDGGHSNGFHNQPNNCHRDSTNESDSHDNKTPKEGTEIGEASQPNDSAIKQKLGHLQVGEHGEVKKSPWQKREERPLIVFNMN